MDDNIIPLADSLEMFFKNLGAPPISVISRLSSEWKKIVGPALAEVTWPTSIIDGELTVACEEPAWSSQVSWMEAQICEQFAELFAPEEIKKVKPIVQQ